MRTNNLLKRKPESGFPGSAAVLLSFGLAFAVFAAGGMVLAGCESPVPRLHGMRRSRFYRRPARYGKTRLASPGQLHRKRRPRLREWRPRFAEQRLPDIRINR